MDKVFEAAQARLEELELEAIELRKFIALYRSTRQKLGLDSLRVSGTNPDQIAPVEGDKLPVDGGGASVSSPPVKRTKVVDNPKSSVVLDAVSRILVEKQTPMSRSQLHAALKERGIIVNGADPIKTLGTILWRGRDRLEQLEGRGYWPKGTPAPDEFA